MAKYWKKELARDCIALGSIPFYLIVIIRAIIGEYSVFIYQLLIALVVLIALSFVKSDMYVARSFVLWVFTSLFYKHNLYMIFAFVLWICIVVSSNYLKVKKNIVIKGALVGIVSAGVGYYLAGIFG